MTENERLTLTIEKAGELLGISRPQAYRLARNGTLPVLSLGRRKVIPIVALERLLAETRPRVG